MLLQDPQTGVTPRPLPPRVNRLLFWHQGAVGDLLLALPALKALAAHYPEASFTGVGNPERLRLLQASLPLEAVWNSSDQVWLELFASGPVSAALRQRLALFDLAVLFTRRPTTPLLARFREAGVRSRLWLPIFPEQTRLPVAAYQAHYLRQAGIPPRLADAGLNLEPQELAKARHWRQEQPPGPVIALAPGSGHPRKNWPLPFFLELAAALRQQHRLTVWWVLGPAEEETAAWLQARLPAAERRFLQGLSLPALAAHLFCCDYFLGNDSGITHLAAAVNNPVVVALFGPSDPRIWAPRSPRAHVLSSPWPCAPCTTGREIACPHAACLTGLSPATVLAALERLQGQQGSPQPKIIQEQSDYPAQHQP